MWAFRQLNTGVGDIATLPSDVVWSFPSYSLYCTRNGQQPTSDQFFQLCPCVLDVVERSTDGHIVIRTDNPNWTRRLRHVLLHAKRPTQATDWTYLTATRFAGNPLTVYSIRTGRRWLTDPQRNSRFAPTSILVEPSLDPVMTWPTVFHRSIPTKYQICVWRCLLHGHYTNITTSKWIASQAPACSLRHTPRENVDHRFRSCPHAVVPF